MTDKLEADLLEAHASDDRAALVRLYTKAAEGEEADGRIDRACFFLTYAWIYALEAGFDEASVLKARLVSHGREVAT